VNSSRPAQTSARQASVNSVSVCLPRGVEAHHVHTRMHACLAVRVHQYCLTPVSKSMAGLRESLQSGELQSAFLIDGCRFNDQRQKVMDSTCML